MRLKSFYVVILSVLASVAVLSFAWEFWLEDWVLPSLGLEHDREDPAERWEYVVTSVFFSVVALIGPTIIGTRIIRRDRRLQGQMIRLAQEDDLTGVYNRRHTAELLQAEIQRAVRYQTRFSVILMDIDHFKAVNDRLGHQAGDRVLRQIAQIVATVLRATDLLGRWGGEEFLIISPETDSVGGLALAEKIRRQIGSADLRAVGRTTASFGVTTFQPGDDIETLVARADAALYRAKAAGRDRVEFGAQSADATPSSVGRSAAGKPRSGN